METLKLKIEGASPLLMHNERGANPLHPLVLVHKSLTSKKKKTEEDHNEIMKSEWMISLYHDQDLGIYLPGVNLKATIVNGAKMNKLGMHVKRSVIVEETYLPLQYGGPSDLDELFADRRFVDVRGVVVMGKRLMRCRPVFRNWSVEATLVFDQSQITRQELLQCVDNASRMVGLGDYRPEKGGPFGRFTVEVL